MEIVPATPAEAVALTDVHVSTWRQAYRDRAAEAWYHERLAAHAVRDWSEVLRSEVARGGGVLVARCDGQVAGFCQYGPTDDPDHDPEQVGQIRRLYVRPERQRSGIGGSLLGASVDRLREHGLHTATLWALETDQRARAFYERHGWELDDGRTTQPPIDLRYRLQLSR